MRLTPATVLDMAFSFNSRAKYPTGTPEVLFAANPGSIVRRIPNPVPGCVWKVSPAQREFGQNRTGLEVYPDAVLAKPGQLCHLVRHRGLRRFSARSPVRTRQTDSVPIPLPHVLPNKEDFGRDTGSTAPGSSLGCLKQPIRPPGIRANL